MSDRKKAHVLISFHDIGTGQTFEEGSTPLIEAGAFANYEHAGLVSAPSAVDEDAEEAPSTSKKSSAKAK